MFLLFGFLGGLILNLMPCVLPVISLKIFGFVQQAGQSRTKFCAAVLRSAIFAWFIALAVLLIALKGAGRDVTWGGFQFTNPYFVLALSVIVLVFALNFGVFEIALPQPVTRNLLSTSERKDLLGSFFQGVFATVLADAVHGAISRHRPRLRVHASRSRHHSGEYVHCHRCRYERAVSAFERATWLAAFFAKAWAVDGGREAVYGLPAVGDAAISALRARRTTRLGRSNLGELFPACDQCRVLDERRVRCANSTSYEVIVVWA